MNNINQVIIEGCVSAAFDNDFIICTERFFKDADGNEKSKFTYLKVFSSDKYKKGDFVRIIGRLHQKRWQDADESWHSQIGIIPEHIDRKPFQNKQPEEVPEETHF